MSKAAPIISNTIRHEFSANNINLNNVNLGYTPIYIYEGFGDFHSAIIKFDSDNILFKFEVDGFIISEIDLNDFNRLLGYANNEDATGPIKFNNSIKTITIAPNYPIQFKENIKIYAKANSNTNSRDCEGYSIFLTKDNL